MVLLGQFLSKMCSKLLERSPLRYSTVRGISCFDPEVLLVKPDTAIKRNALLCKVFVLRNRISHSESDLIEKQFDRLVTMVGTKLKSAFEAFHPDPKQNTDEENYRLDALYSSVFCASNFPNGHEELYKLVQDALTFSQGNAPVEAGFSINENMLEENMETESIVYRRYFI